MSAAPAPAPARPAGNRPRLVSEGPVRVVLAGPAGLARELLAAALRRTPAVQLVGVVRGGEEMASLLARRTADVVLVAGGEDRAGRCAEIAALRDRHPRLEIVALGALDDEVPDLAEAGATGYSSREAGFDELMLDLVALHAGRSRCAPAVATRLVERLRSTSAGRPRGAPAAEITQRERQVLDALSRGLTNKEIAHELGLALSTIKNHVHSVLHKLGADNRRNAVRIAYERGLTDDYLPVSGG